jgi:hypothetical protein
VRTRDDCDVDVLANVVAVDGEMANESLFAHARMADGVGTDCYDVHQTSFLQDESERAFVQRTSVGLGY